MAVETILKTGTKLDEILAHTRDQVAQRKATVSISELEQQASAHAPRGFAASLRRVAETGPAVIAELKKASPSKGLIREQFVPVELARSLEAGGAAALSVLTDEKFFRGSLAYLAAASSTVGIPCLRKDFMVDPFQMLEARANGADAVLLIVAAHTDAALQELRAAAQAQGLDVLCEVHDAGELDRALMLGCEAVGVNSRDLRDFTMHPERMFELVERIPSDVVRVAESGLRDGQEMRRLRDAGYHAFLMGETLMRQADPGAALAEMLGRAVAAV